MYLGVLHALRELGVMVWNDARAIERCVDKSTTTFFLQRAGIPTPWTWTGAGREAAEAIAAASSPEGIGSCRSRCSVRKARACA